MSLKVFPPGDSGGGIVLADTYINYVDLLSNGVSSTYSLQLNTDKISRLKVSGGGFATNAGARMFQGMTSVKIIDIRKLNFTSMAVIDFNTAFKTCTSLERVYLPKNITNIGPTNQMFHGCSSLKSIDMSRHTTDGNSSQMFYNCTSLKKVKLGGSPISGSSYSHVEIFRGCSNLEEVHILEIIASNIGGMFQSCTSLKNIIIEDVSRSSLVDTNCVSNTFTSTGNIEKIILGGYKGNSGSISSVLDLSNNKIGIDAMEDFFNALGTATLSRKTIDVTGNPAVSHPDYATVKTIATGKGFTVTP